MSIAFRKAEQMAAKHSDAFATIRTSRTTTAHLGTTRRLSGHPVVVALGSIERLRLSSIARIRPDSVVVVRTLEKLATVLMRHPMVAGLVIAEDAPELTKAICLAELWVRRAPRFVVSVPDGARTGVNLYQLTNDPECDVREALRTMEKQAQRCELFAAMYGLSSREAELLSRLARGARRSGLHHALGVDRRTVATMAARIIAKTQLLTLDAVVDALVLEMGRSAS